MVSNRIWYQVRSNRIRSIMGSVYGASHEGCLDVDSVVQKGCRGSATFVQIQRHAKRGRTAREESLFRQTVREAYTSSTCSLLELLRLVLRQGAIDITSKTSSIGRRREWWYVSYSPRAGLCINTPERSLLDANSYANDRQRHL
jgi:hypothetical protein